MRMEETSGMLFVHEYLKSTHTTQLDFTARSNLRRICPWKVIKSKYFSTLLIFTARQCFHVIKYWFSYRGLSLKYKFPDLFGVNSPGDEIFPRKSNRIFLEIKWFYFQKCVFPKVFSNVCLNDELILFCCIPVISIEFFHQDYFHRKVF